MSQYLKFVLKRCGAPVPARVIVSECQQEWANRQVLDEFAAAFPGVELMPLPGASGADLVVFPYLGQLDEEIPRWRSSWQQLSDSRCAWVMLYGVRHRRIEVLPARYLPRFVDNCSRVSLVMRVLCRLSLLHPLSRLLERKYPL